MKDLPAPGVATKSDLPIVTTTCTLSWSARAKIIAVIKSRYSNDIAEVGWSLGAQAMMPEHPEYTVEDVMKWKFDGDFPRQTNPCALKAFLQHQAEHLGGTLAVTQNGLWPAMDEVKA